MTTEQPISFRKTIPIVQPQVFFDSASHLVIECEAECQRFVIHLSFTRTGGSGAEQFMSAGPDGEVVIISGTLASHLHAALVREILEKRTLTLEIRDVDTIEYRVKESGYPKGPPGDGSSERLFEQA